MYFLDNHFAIGHHSSRLSWKPNYILFNTRSNSLIGNVVCNKSIHSLSLQRHWSFQAQGQNLILYRFELPSASSFSAQKSHDAWHWLFVIFSTNHLKYWSSSNVGSSKIPSQFCPLSICNLGNRIWSTKLTFDYYYWPSPSYAVAAVTAEISAASDAAFTTAANVINTLVASLKTTLAAIVTAMPFNNFFSPKMSSWQPCNCGDLRCTNQKSLLSSELCILRISQFRNLESYIWKKIRGHWGCSEAWKIF